VGVGTGVGKGVGVGIGVGVTVGIGVGEGKGSEGGHPTQALDHSPSFNSLATPLAMNQTSPLSDMTMVKPSPSTITLKVVPLTTAVPAGVSNSYLEAESTSFCTRLTLLPANCFKLIEVEPVPAAALISLTSTWVSAATSITLPSKKTIRADPSLPVLSWSPASSFIPATAATQVVEPCFCTSTSPEGEEIVPG